MGIHLEQDPVELAATSGKCNPRRHGKYNILHATIPAANLAEFVKKHLDGRDKGTVSLAVQFRTKFYNDMVITFVDGKRVLAPDWQTPVLGGNVITVDYEE
jgi:hypothetical protein